MRATTTKKAKTKPIRLDDNPQAFSQFVSESAFASTTDHLVRWDEAWQAIQPLEPLSPTQRCELFLRAVNGDELTGPDWSRLVGAPVGAIAAAIPAPARKSLRNGLVRVISNPKTAIKSFGANSAAIGNNNVVAYREKTVIDGRWTYAERILARSPAEALIYALDLFLDPEKDFGASLRQCCREGCDRFGLAKPQTTPGYPPNFYCTPEHRDEHKRKQAIERARAQREGMTVDEYREDQQRKQK
jgi:hypothetical protein